MKKGAGKNKGGSFEREMCKAFSLWWSGGKSKEVFWRSAGSGAKSTVTKSNLQCGDMVQIDPSYPEFPFSAEFKFYKTFDLYDIFEPEKKTNKILGWLKQCLIDAKRAHKEPLLVIKRNFSDPLVVIPSRMKFWFRHKEWIEFEYNDCDFLMTKLKNLFEIDAKDIHSPVFN